MITTLTITTISVLWILAEVRGHICRMAWNNEIEYRKLVQEERDKLRDQCNEGTDLKKCTERDSVLW